MEISPDSPQKARNWATFDPAVPIMGIFPKVSNYYFEETCSIMSIAVLFTKVKKESA